jgi:hypothetical protein
MIDTKKEMIRAEIAEAEGRDVPVGVVFSMIHEIDRLAETVGALSVLPRGYAVSKTITLTEEEATLIEGLIFDAKRAASKLQTMYLRDEVEPRLELDRLVEQRDLYLKAQKILRERMAEEATPCLNKGV